MHKLTGRIHCRTCPPASQSTWERGRGRQRGNEPETGLQTQETPATDEQSQRRWGRQSRRWSVPLLVSTAQQNQKQISPFIKTKCHMYSTIPRIQALIYQL